MSNLAIPRIYKSIFENIYNKKIQFDAVKNEVETLAFGNSQGDGCFDTRDLPTAFNACTRSQDLKYSYLLYEKIGEQAKNLKQVILFYSFISPGFVTEENRGEQGVTLGLNEFFDLKVEYSDMYLANTAEDLAGAPTDSFRRFDGARGFFPTVHRTYFDEPYWENRRAIELLALNAKTDSLPYLERFINLAKQRGHALYFVIPPNDPAFTNSVGRRTEDLHKHLYEAMRAHGIDTQTHLLDLYHAQALVDKDFADYNHIVPESAATREITRQIVQMLAA